MSKSSAGRVGAKRHTFFIAGALSALIPKEATTRYLGRDAPRWISYPASAVGGFVLAVCSCTIIHSVLQWFPPRSMYSSD